MTTPQCALACLAAPGCEGFTINAVQKGCYLKVWGEAVPGWCSSETRSVHEAVPRRRRPPPRPPTLA